jgi:hypothetical protein
MISKDKNILPTPDIVIYQGGVISCNSADKSAGRADRKV